MLSRLGSYMMTGCIIAKIHILAVMHTLDLQYLFIIYRRQGHLDAVVTLMRHGADSGLQDSEGKEYAVTINALFKSYSNMPLPREQNF